MFFPLNRQDVYRRIYNGVPIPDLEDYFPSIIKQSADRLQRKGLVEKIETAEGTVIKITEKGKSELLKFKLSELAPKTGKWDGRWRVVFFDIAELSKSRRDKFRAFLLQLGMKRFQDSVFITPYDVSSEIKYLREYLDIPDGVKLAEMSWIENAEELKEMFYL